MTDGEGDDRFERFAFIALGAISRFAREKNIALARSVRQELRRHCPTGIFGDDHNHSHLWDEYCFEVQHGPTPELERAWKDHIQPFVAHRLSGLSEIEADLLSVAAEWSFETIDRLDGSARRDDLISQEIWGALRDLADDDAKRRAPTRAGGAYS